MDTHWGNFLSSTYTNYEEANSSKLETSHRKYHNKDELMDNLEVVICREIIIYTHCDIWDSTLLGTIIYYTCKGFQVIDWWFMSKLFIVFGEGYITKNGLITRERTSCPKSAGGMRLPNIKLFNKSIVAAKMCCDLASKTDKLWIKWIHDFYIKDQIYGLPIINRAGWLERLCALKI